MLTQLVIARGVGSKNLVPYRLWGNPRPMGEAHNVIGSPIGQGLRGRVGADHILNLSFDLLAVSGIIQREDRLPRWVIGWWAAG